MPVPPLTRKAPIVASLTPDDMAALAMLSRARFAPDAVITLPSGLRVTGANMARAFGTEPISPERHPACDASSLSSSP